MTTLAHETDARTGFVGWVQRAENWLDEKGKFAWIATLVFFFIFAWPLGLALLAYMIWSRKMICTSRRTPSARQWQPSSRTTGNSAFDAYRDQTLRRLEEEQQNFEAFLERLRAARDKSEFDQFMEDRARNAASQQDDSTPERA